MIAEIHARDGKGGGAGAVVEYAIGRKAARTKRAEVVANTTTGRTAREIAQELDAVGALRPDVTTRRVEHYTLSLAPGEGLSVEQWGELAREYAAHMGHAACPYVAAVHRDTKHEHLHLVAGRVDVDGRLVSDRRNYRRAQEFCREKERDLGLRAVASSWERGVERAEPRPSRGAIERAVNEGREPLAIEARQTFAAALRGAGSWAEAHAAAAAHGYTIAPGIRGPGLTLSDGQETTKLSTVGRDLSRPALEKRLGTYERGVIEREPEREHPTRPAVGRDRDGVPEPAARNEGAARGAATPGSGAAGPGAPGRARESGRAGVADIAARGGGDPAGPLPAARGGAERGAGSPERGGPGAHGRDSYGDDGRDRGRAVRDGDRPGAGVVHGADGGRGAHGQDLGGGRAERAGELRTRGLDGDGPHVAGVGDGERGARGAGAPHGAPTVGGGPAAGGGRGMADDRGAADAPAQRLGDRGLVPEPAGDGGRPLPDGVVRPVAAAPGVPAPAAGERVAGRERVDPADPQARQVAEAALRSAERQGALHRAADGAREAHGRAWGRLYRDPRAAAAARDRMARTIGADVAADTLRRSPQEFGALTAEGAEAVARGSGRELAAAIERTGTQWREAETQRPRTPAAQVTAELQRAQLGVEPFRAFDRAQAQVRELARAAERALGLDRDHGRGGRGR